MFKSIRLKITVIFMLLVILTELFVGLYGIFSTVQYYHKRFDDSIAAVFTSSVKNELTEAANAVSVSDQTVGENGIIMNETGPDNVDNIKNIISQYAGPLSINVSTFFCILDHSGAVVYSSNNAGITEASEVIDSALAGNEAINSSYSGEYMDYALPLMSGGDVRYIIYVKDTLSLQKTVTNRMGINLAVSLLLSAAISLLLGSLLARSITIPIKRLSAQAKKLAEGELSSLTRSDRTDELGELTNALIYLADSNREYAEKERAEKTKLSTILQNMNDGILAFDSKGRLTHINREAQKLLNRKYIDDITFNRFFKEINADITLEALQYIPSDDSVEREIRLNNQVLQLNFALYSRENSDGGVIVIIHDVTKHERLEHARRDFVADVSHELRTPLTVIKSYADILADTPDAEPEVRTRFLDTISSETDRMTKIISDLLTLSKLDENANYSRPNDEIDIRAMLEGLVERLSLTAKKKNQTLTYTPINDVPYITGDRDGLERVFTNVISNALKYTPSGGKINIFSSKVYNDILVKVSDNGIGIPKDQLPNIFDRFYRVDKARSRDKGGTGLGLAIAKQTIESSFHGKISISSELNKGTDVIMTIPAPKR